jgi:hypothetical protein
MHESIKPRRRRVSSPWVWGAAGLLAVVLLGASALHFVTASCAAALSPSALSAALPQSGPPSATTLTQGQAYFYNPADGEGSCSFGRLPADGLYVSLAAPQYAGGASCGSYLNVSGPDGTVRAEVVDLCPGCTNGGVDLSQAAFGRVADTAAGTAEVSYRLVRDPMPPAPVEVRIARSSSAGWLALQVINNGNPLGSVAVAPTGSGAPGRWQPLTLNSDGYWVAATGAGPGPFMVRITDIFGDRVVADGIRLSPGSVQYTGLLMYHADTAGSGPASAGPASAAASAAARPTQARTSVDRRRGYSRASGKPGPAC